jgi:hypothetical protein
VVGPVLQILLKNVFANSFDILNVTSPVEECHHFAISFDILNVTSPVEECHHFAISFDILNAGNLDFDMKRGNVNLTSSK